MSNKLKIYRVDDTWIGDIFRKFRGSTIPPMKNSAMTSIPKAIKDYFADDNIYLLSGYELKRFKNALGNSWINNTQYYIRHPKEEKTSYLIESDKFFDYIEQEKISEIIAFIRIHCPGVKHIHIKSTNANGFRFCSNSKFSFVSDDADDEGKYNSLNVGLNAHGKRIGNYEIEIDCDKKIPIAKQRHQFLWIEEMPILMEACDSGDTFSIKQIIENDWGIDSKLATHIHMNIDVSGSMNSDSKYYLEIRVS